MPKTLRLSLAFCAGLIVLFGLIVTAPSHAAVGRTQGNFNVSSTGSASYTIPIFTPPGPNGIQPSVALVYNSNGGFGYLGKGWSLAGFSSISRCNSTIAQDGNARDVYLWDQDALCLDGNRLRVQSGTYGQGGSNVVYATEVADFSRITSTGSGNSGSAAAYRGPQYWTVERKDGLIYTYGGTADSRIVPNSSLDAVSQWLLSEIRDRNGNKVRFTWKTPDSTTVRVSHPTKIEWARTSASSSTYVYSMDFNYTAGGNAAASTYSGYLAQYARKDSDLLASISVSVSGTVKRKYVLNYETSASTGSKRLAEVKECVDSAGSDCLVPTTFDYQESTPGYNVGSPALNVSGSVTQVDGRHDFNGDGIKDISYVKSGTVYVRFGSKTGSYSAEYSTGQGNIRAGKLLGNGSDQFLGSISYTWYIFYWNGSSFSSINTGISFASSSNNVELSDVDADGRDDLVYPLNMGTMPTPGYSMPYVEIFSRRNTSSVGTVSFAAPFGTGIIFYDADIPYEYVPPGYTMTAEFDSFLLQPGGDSNGDGRGEVNAEYTYWYCFYDPYNYPVWCNWVAGAGLVGFWGSANYAGLYDFNANAPWNYGAKLTETDVNRDGCDDYVNEYSAEQVLSGCASDSTATAFSWSSLGGDYLGSADFNDDGIADSIVKDTSTNALSVRTLLSDESLGSLTSLGITCSATGYLYFVVTDGNGDGRDDIGCFNYGSGLTIYNSSGVGTPDLLTHITDGYGVEQIIEYASIADGPYTPYSNATYPLRDVASGLIVVSSVEATDGAGGTFTADYEYYGAAQDVSRRSFTGFDKVETVDSRNGVRHVRQFSRSFPYAGMQIGESTYQPGNTVMSSMTMTPATTTLDATANNQRYFPYPASSALDEYEVGGSSNGAWITRTSVSNTFDSWGNLTASTKTVTDKDSYSPWYTYSWITSTSATITPNTTYWCLGLPSASSVTSTSTTYEATVIRSKSFDPDYVNCRMNGESVEPSSSTLRVDTSYGYDVFGNVNSVAVTGRKPDTSSMTARTTSTTWGSADGTTGGTGQFPVIQTNALGQSSYRTFHSTFGRLLTETDPNGIVVANSQYDSIGRVSRATRADGTYTEIVRSYCEPWCKEANYNPGSAGLNRVIVQAFEHDASGNTIRESEVYTDQFDRVIVEASQTLSGGYNRIGHQYDAFGREFRTTAPCDYYSCTYYWTTNTYDLLGRVLTQTRPFSDSNSTPMTTTFAYAGRTQTVTDPNSKTTTKILDVNGWLRRSQDHSGYYQSFGYDGAGSVKQVLDSLSNSLFSAVYSYGIQPFQTWTLDMDLGNWTYTYNSLGELVSWSDAKSNSFSQTYDPLSRVTSRTESEGTTSWTWGYTPANHDIGQLVGVSMPASSYSESLSYDSVGRLSTYSINAESTGNDTGYAYAFDYAYNTQGLLDTTTYPTSTSSTRVKVKYGYAYGVLNSVTDWTSGSAGTVYWTANTQGLGGQITQDTLGNGVVTNRSFDTVTGRLNSIQSAVGGGTGLQNQSYAYDAIGNVTQRQENTLGLTENFYYDNLYRLTSSQVNSNTAMTYAYDAMGNITSKSNVGSYDYTTAQTGCSYYSNTQKHAVRNAGGKIYCYDANGNMTSRDGATIGWSSFNYPIYLAKDTETSQFVYGPDRQYYKQVYTNTSPAVSETTYYIGGLLEKVDDGSTIDWRHNIIANGQVVAIVSRKSTSTNAVHYMLNDHQSSGSTLTNSSGSLLVRESFNAFGLPRDGADWDGAVPSGDQATINAISRRGYTGHSMLGAMGLIHMNGRVQDAISGRFLSADPTIPNPGFTQSYNRYAYVNNNPLSYVDPSGFADVGIYSYGRAACDMGWETSMERCGGYYSFTEMSESGFLFDFNRSRYQQAGCGLSIIVDCDAYLDWLSQQGVEKRERSKKFTVDVGDLELPQGNSLWPKGSWLGKFSDWLHKEGESYKHLDDGLTGKERFELYGTWPGAKISFEGPYGDLQIGEIRAIQGVVDEAGRPLDVVGSAARGARSPTSDIDYVASPSSLKYFEGLEGRLPGIDPEHGIIPGYGNRYIGPVIRFSPGGVIIP